MADGRAVSLVFAYFDENKSLKVFEYPGSGGDAFSPGISNLNTLLQTYNIQQVESPGAPANDGLRMLLFHLVKQ